MKTIPLTKGREAKVDDSDFEGLLHYRWSLYVAKYKRDDGTEWTRCYAVARIGGRTVLMHRAIMGNPAGRRIDHKDGDGLNNTRSNLRIATAQQNAWNTQTTRSRSGYRGVQYDPVSCRRGIETGRRKPWRAFINNNGKRYSIGMFSTAVKAAKAYDTVARIVRGEFAVLNFPRQCGPRPADLGGQPSRVQQ